MAFEKPLRPRRSFLKGMAAGTGDEQKPSPILSLPAMRYPNEYVWLVLLSSLDIMLTWIVLQGWGGHEANPLAAAVFASRGLQGAVLYKFALVLLAIILCEGVGRRHDRDGRRLASLFLFIGAVPVVFTFMLLMKNPPLLDVEPVDILGAITFFRFGC